MENKVEKLVGKHADDIDKIIQNTPSCLKIINKKGELLNMNPQGLKLIGAEDLESVLLANVYEIIEESHREKFKKFNEKVCSGIKGHLEFDFE